MGDLPHLLFRGNMDMEQGGNRTLTGSITVEASIVMPIVIICILPFIYLFRMLLFQMVVEKSLDECLREMAAEVYILERISIMPEYDAKTETQDVDKIQMEQIETLVEEYTALLDKEEWKKKLEEMGFELLGELLLEQKLKKQLGNENLEAWGVAEGWNGVSFLKSEFFYSEEGHHYLLKGAVNFKWNKMFSFWDPKTVNVTRVYHAFVGEEIQYNENNEDIESEKSEMVYLIGNGTRYHRSNCYLICKDTFATTKSGAEQTGSKPCGRCNPQNEMTVYKTNGGEHYHTDTCSYLYPDVTSIPQEEAIQLGYSGCGICHGENGYFS